VRHADIRRVALGTRGPPRPNAKELAWWDKHFVGEPLSGTFVEATVAEPGRSLHLRVARVEVEVDAGTDQTLLRRVRDGRVPIPRGGPDGGDDGRRGHAVRVPIRRRRVAS
jgi:hypothetical protein